MKKETRENLTIVTVCVLASVLTGLVYHTIYLHILQTDGHLCLMDVDAAEAENESEEKNEYWLYYFDDFSTYYSKQQKIGGFENTDDLHEFMLSNKLSPTEVRIFKGLEVKMECAFREKN